MSEREDMGDNSSIKESSPTMSTTPHPAETEASDAARVAASLDLLVDDHEEEVSEGGRTVKRRGVYLLPNLFTTGALFAGFYAVVAAMRGDFESAPIAIFLLSFSMAWMGVLPA